MKKLLFFMTMASMFLTACSPKSYNYTTEELMLQSGENAVYGILYRPEGVKEAPLVIFSHGYGGSHEAGKGYAEMLAPKGYAVYLYDFPGGSIHGRSQGASTHMSLFTEKADLKAIIRQLSAREGIDAKHITLIGESQGGMVSALTAAECQAAVERLILVFPAFCIKDDWVKRYPTLSDMPEEVDLWGMKLGHAYLEGLYNLDVYGTIGAYEGPVTIFHGDKDQIVPYSYSVEAEKTYKNASLTLLPGEGHGFTPAGQAQVLEALSQLM